MRKYKAFTLAEVLLVLAIIGVIAAVTIPATMQQSGEKKFAALGKKALSTLQNAIDLKLTLVPRNAGQAGMTLFQWLADGEQFGYAALKVADHNANWSVVQTADGMIWSRVSDYTDSNYKTGRYAVYRIDLNGAEGPTKSTVQSGLGGAEGYRNDAKSYDVIYVMVNQQGQVVTHGNTLHGDNEDDRALRYFGHDAR